MEKEKYEVKQEIRNQIAKPSDIANPNEIVNLRNHILKEISERREFEEKIKEIKEDFLIIKNEMGGLNATSQLQERYEKHIKILENRLDKANQKFNESIEYDKKLREEIDKLRKERFFFEDIYKKLEKDLENLRKEISVNLEAAYECYEKRDKNQEVFENLKSEMMKKETEYAQKLSQIANDLTIRNSRKKSLETKEKFINTNQEENLIENNFKFYAKKMKNDNIDSEDESKIEKLQNLQYKFQKLEEFTELSNYNVFCKIFKENAQKNFDLFLAISLISKEAKQSEKEIKDLEDEIKSIKLIKAGQSGIEKTQMLNELKSKTQKLIQKQDKYDNDCKKNTDEFKQIKNSMFILFRTLECDKELSNVNKLQMENGVSESNAGLYLSEVEKKLKTILKFYENERMNTYEENGLEKGKTIEGKDKVKNPKQVADDMKAVFASMGKNNYFN
jgi:coiled-coil domain-containing protein 63/114